CTRTGGASCGSPRRSWPGKESCAWPGWNGTPWPISGLPCRWRGADWLQVLPEFCLQTGDPFLRLRGCPAVTHQLGMDIEDDLAVGPLLLGVPRQSPVPDRVGLLGIDVLEPGGGLGEGQAAVEQFLDDLALDLCALVDSPDLLRTGLVQGQQ